MPTPPDQKPAPLSIRAFLKSPRRDAALMFWLVSLDFTFFRDNAQIGDLTDSMACLTSVVFGWACADYWKERSQPRPLSGK